MAVVQDLKKSQNVNVVFRGHAQTSFTILPSLFRNKKRYRNEHLFLRSVLASQPDSFANDQTSFDRLVRMQHFSIPTRLLDVTWNPLVALYFAVKDSPTSDAHIKLIGFQQKDEKFFDSDTVSCLANLSYMKATERNAVRNILNTTPSIGRRPFNEEEVIKRLIQFIKSEKPYFQSDIDPEALNKAVLVRPKFSNRRIIAQSGAFVLFGLGSKPLDDDPKEFDIQTITILATDKSTISKELDTFGINDESMFPELESAGKYIATKYG